MVAEGDVGDVPGDMLQELANDVADMCAVLADMRHPMDDMCIIAGDQDGELTWEQWCYGDMVDNDGVVEIAEALVPLRRIDVVPVWFWTKECNRVVFVFRMVWSTPESNGCALC